jgi:hypothetical protein
MCIMLERRADTLKHSTYGVTDVEHAPDVFDAV